MARKKSNKEKLFSIRCNLGIFLWVLGSLSVILGVTTFNNFFLYFSSIIFYVISALNFIGFLYFKKIPSIGSSPSKGIGALIWMLGQSAFAFYLGYKSWSLIF